MINNVTCGILKLHNERTTMDLQTRANEIKEYWTGTLHEKIIQMYQDNKDEANLLKAVAEAESEASMQEINGAGLL